MAVAVIHPGEHLAEGLEALDINRVTQVLNGTRSVTGDIAQRLAHFFGTTGQFWLNLQDLYDLRLAPHEDWEVRQGVA